MHSVEIRNLNKFYGRFQALTDINLALEEGEFVVMVGPSGCGKSTLLRTIAGLEDSAEGEIYVKGREVSGLAARDRGLAMVFQNYALYPHMTVAENMGFALRLAKRPKAEIAAAVQHAAETLQLTELLDKKPRHLSGGQRQRVAIGRAITRAPDVFLFDEPLSNLDAALRAQMRVELTALHRSLGASMIYVTHDQVEAMTMADRIVLLRDGVIEQVGKPLDLYNKPANRFVAGFLGSPKMNFFNVTVTTASDALVSVAFGQDHSIAFAASAFRADVPEPGARLTAGIRPEHFWLERSAGQREGACFDAEIVLEERLGRETVLYARSARLQPIGTEQHYIVVHRNVQSEFVPGDHVQIGFEPTSVCLFAEDGRAIHWPAIDMRNKDASASELHHD